MPAIPANPLFVAVDTPELARATQVAAALADVAGGLKLGLEFFTANGIKGVRQVARASGDLPVFLDLKFHDIPNTVAGAVRAACAARPAIVNVHAAGGRAMMRAAAEAARDGAERHVVTRPLVLAVTLLTSLDQEDLADIGVSRGVGDQVVALAQLAKESGLDGVVCSAHEVAAIRAACGPRFTLMVPGVRPAWAGSDDQKRTATPAEAMAQGADYLVVGRPVTGAAAPADAARRVLSDLPRKDREVEA
jgi:orotidine-5'-phosphate decarboxylase